MSNKETKNMPGNEMKKDDDNVVQQIDNQTGTKPKRKSRSSRRRLNAMMSNVSLHFSDTDSEGELPTVVLPKRNLSPAAKRLLNKVPEPPMISVTVENAEGETVDSHWDGFGEIENNTRRNSFAENLTDVDEIYGSEGDTAKPSVKGLSVIENSCQGETDLEDLSNDDGDDEETNIIIEASSVDIFHEFGGGGTTTTKEGDGPFSNEVRQQMSFDEGDETTRQPFSNHIVFPSGPPTDCEDYEVSDDDEDDDFNGACGQHNNSFHNFDFLANSQVENISKMTNSLTVPDLTEDGLSDGHTDVEDFE
ncbi:uncharacterized protein LOC122848121 [Aphidius gifuensis]|uniref:uncharacterized protein LOC122848121 n=1 Tax=Aphidius gifuensis TaxID=684658 RepID=UPI001CDC6978|nr:uncharacterized protein LOC122848121 [Aphidius gifuensis]